MAKKKPLNLASTISAEQAVRISQRSMFANARPDLSTAQREMMIDSLAQVLPLRAADRQVGGDHYKGDAIQHYEFCQRNKLGWCESAAIKYIIRHGKKNGRQDLEKAIHYIQLLMELQYPISQPSTAV